MAEFRLATFSADVTIPLGHTCMGILPTPSLKIVDPLFAHGFVLLGADKPIVLVAIDWCEIRNLAYDRWRIVVAEAAGTTPDRVLLSSLHQHDAPVTDLGVEHLLSRAGLSGAMFDFEFHEKTVQRVAEAVRDSLDNAIRVTHIGTGQAKVEKVASNRRVVSADGRVSYGRGSRSGGNAAHRDAPDGEIDPWLKTLSFWDGDKPIAAMHAYATHPMSYYGRGGVSADFVGMARSLRHRDDQRVHQIYVSGCSGDVTAGKYNDGSPANRPLLANRLHVAMKKAWDATKRHPLKQVDFRKTELDLEFRKDARYQTAALWKTLDDDKASKRDRILAAMALASRQRVASGQSIDFPCVDFGAAQLVLFPAESFVGYQLMAQKMRPDSFVVSVGYGECWPGYIPMKASFDDKFNDVWLWVAPGAEERMHAALKKVLPAASK
jgi:hypothetical protein